MSAPHAIGLVTPGWTPDVGPAETLGEALTRALLAAGLRPHVLAAEHDPRRPAHALREERIGGLSIRRLNLPSPSPEQGKDLEPSPAVEGLAAAWMADRGIDLVHALDTGPLGMAALRAGQARNTPAVATLLDHAALCPRRRMVDAAGRACAAPESERCAACQAATWLRLDQDRESAGRRTSRALATLRGTQRLLAASQATIEVGVRVGLARERFELCPPGVETQTLALSTELARGSLPAGRRLGVISATRPSAGVLELAHAVCLADRPGLVLEVHGPLVDSHGDATYLNALRRLADLEGRVRLHGSFARRDLPRVLATLDGLAAPDRCEVSTALAVREARAVGLPVLASDRGVHREFADDPGIRLVGEGLDAWSRAVSRFRFERTGPAPVRSLLSMAEQVLAAYRGAARCGPAPATLTRSSSHPRGLETNAAPRPSST